MKHNVPSEKTSDAMGRPWWQVRRTLWCAMVLVCLAPVAIWFHPDYRVAMEVGLLQPFAEAVKPLLRFEMLVALGSSTGAGLIIGWVLRRVRGLRPQGPSAQTA